MGDLLQPFAVLGLVPLVHPVVVQIASFRSSLAASDAVASRLQISDLYKFDLQVASQFANWSKRAPEHVY